MSRTLALLLTSLLVALLAAPALAQEEDEVEEEETITGRAPSAPAVLESASPEAATSDEVERSDAGRPYTDAVYAGAEALGLDAAFIQKCYAGTRLVYQREYKAAKQFFDGMEKDHPGLAIQHVGAVLIYQSKMMENFDFRFERQYQYHSDAAVELLEAKLDAGEGSRGERALRHFFAGAMMGVESIHVMRRGEFVPALTRGIEAIGHIDEVRELAPDFRDPLLADGLFKYWRSVVSMNSKVLPDLEDERAEGIAAMQSVEEGGVFLGPGATMALAFTWIEERQLDRALASCLKNYRAFPKNVINNLVLSRVYMYKRQYKKSLRILQEIEAEAPKNQRVHYYYATPYPRLDELDKAEASVERYLAFEDLDDYFRAQALHRKGDIAYRRKQFAEAERLYKEAVKTGDYKPAKKKLDRMRELKREGKILY